MSSIKKKLTYSIGANIISLIISIFTSIGIPKMMGEDICGYGYFQIFVFYTGYIGFLHLGFCDGIILRVVGEKYDNLNKALYSGQFRLLFAIEIIIGLLIAVCGSLFTKNLSYQFIWGMVGINTILIIPKLMLLDILQVTTRVKEYARITIITRLSFFILVVLGIMFSYKNFEFLVFIQTAGEAIGLVVAIWICKDIVFFKSVDFRRCIHEMKLNMHSGYKLLVSNIAGLLFAGIPRIFVQVKYDTTLYGKVAFAFIISNMVLSFISAIEIVLYPEFKDKDRKRLKEIYEIIDTRLMCVIFCSMALYYPVYLIIGTLLPQYHDSLQYMVYLIPLCAYSSKMSILVQNDMKIFRMEKEIMKVNLLTVVLSVVMVGACYLLLEGDLKWLMASVTVAYAIRCIFAEVLLNRELSVFSVHNAASDILISVSFMICMSYGMRWWAVGIYGCCLVVYLIVRDHRKYGTETEK